MQLAIAQNPHSQEPKELWELLNAEDSRPEEIEFDREGLLALKNKLIGSKGIIVK